MAPIKAPNKPLNATTKPLNTTTNILRRGISTRSQQNAKTTVTILKESRTKRKANSPLKESKDVKQIDLGAKRTAFSDLTNATAVTNDNNDTKKNAVKKVTVQSKYLTHTKTVDIENKRDAPLTRQTTQTAGHLKKTKSVTAGGVTQATKPTIPSLARVKLTTVNEIVNKKTVLRPSDTSSEKSEDSLYVSAAEELNESSAPDVKSTKSAPIEKKETEEKKKESEEKKKDSPVFRVVREPDEEYVVPEGVHDFDKENWNDIYQVSHYAMDVFNYLKKRESHFKVNNYIHKQPHITIYMRSLLIDWMVEVQESFELNHETLYLAVKLVDIYLNKIQIAKDLLQLVGAASLFIASKFDERSPPLISDFLYICDGAYEKRQMLKMEIGVLKSCNFEMGIPLSYRFLRRYARCAKITMPTLTLARFILEYSLMDYTTITHSDSKLAAAALYIALRMEKISDWTKTLEYYSGYKLEDFWPQVKILNDFLHKKPQASLNTIRNKYSHKLFYEVAKKPLITL